MQTTIIGVNCAVQLHQDASHFSLASISQEILTALLYTTNLLYKNMWCMKCKSTNKAKIVVYNIIIVKRIFYNYVVIFFIFSNFPFCVLCVYQFVKRFDFLSYVIQRLQKCSQWYAKALFFFKSYNSFLLVYNVKAKIFTIFFNINMYHSTDIVQERWRTGFQLSGFFFHCQHTLKFSN